MIAVIIAGGSGTRLWPLSTPTYPKQLLSIDGDNRTLLQHTYDRAKELADHVYVIPEVSLVDHVKKQLPELPQEAYISEPGRRGTANCIIAGLAHVKSRHDPDEPIAFVGSDHHIRDKAGFVHSFKIAAEASKASGRIVLVGVEPDYPATGLGYIQKADTYASESLVFNVHSFKEKPDFELARKFFQSGDYLWNCNYFLGSVKTFEKAMAKHAPSLLKNYERLVEAKTLKDYEDTYLSFETDQIDYALMEHADDLLVVPATFDWMDVGSYADLHKAVESDEQGNHVYGEAVELEDVENCFVHNHDNTTPLAVIGLDNVVIINTKDGILVARKDLSKKIGEVSKRINSK
jgi:mannose-1-phosphate guanylyltransferase/mannose-6-phosphate isomerase